MEKLIRRLLAILERQQYRINAMDAQVVALTANVATLQTQVTQVLADAKVIDPADEAALVAANQGLTAISAQLSTFLSPTGATGASGTTGTAEATPTPEAPKV